MGAYDKNQAKSMGVGVTGNKLYIKNEQVYIHIYHLFTKDLE
tara:strand:- start:67 stop:192 length:126 start_codon:yes stop_codon:yes gene_type:complete